MGVSANLIDAIYEAAVDQAAWDKALATLCEEIGATSAWILLADPASQNLKTRLLSHGSDSRWLELLHPTYTEICPFGADLRESGEGVVFTMLSVLSGKELNSSRFYTEWCVPQGIRDLAAATIVKQASRTAVLWLARHNSRQRFTPEDMRRLASLAPHLKRSLFLSERLNQRAVQEAANETVVENISVAIAVVDGSGRLVTANPAAQTLIRDGRLLTLRRGRLTIQDGSRGVEAVLESATKAPVVVALGQGEKRLLLAVILPVLNCPSAFAILVQCPQERLSGVREILSAAFALTPREVAVLTRLIEGKPLEEIARELGVGYATARTHLNSLFVKTGTSRQVDLVQYVTRALPPVVLS